LEAPRLKGESFGDRANFDLFKNEGLGELGGLLFADELTAHEGFAGVVGATFGAGLGLGDDL
jgi:hypothetical protein